MTRSFMLLAVILVASLIAFAAAEPPTAHGPDRPGFSAMAAHAHVREIASQARPTGSAGNLRARGYIVAQLRQAGLNVMLQETTSVRQAGAAGSPVLMAPVANIIAVLPGRNRNAAPVALMAHYDSVISSPGAGDDASGSAVLIESARSLAAGPRPYRDVIFLFTDGEEQGLLGAHAFFKRHPAAVRIGAVVNVEARGSTGRATMFETSSGNAELISMWANNVPNATGHSLTAAVYERMPNDTDLSVALDTGKIGINAAFVGGQFDYHNPTDSPENLDPGSLQHLGDFALGMTGALAMAVELPERSGRTVFFDVFGLGVIRYPAWAGWMWQLVVGGAIVAAYRSWRRNGVSLNSLARGASAFLGLLALTAVVLTSLHALLSGDGTIAAREVLAELSLRLCIYGLVALGVMIVVAPWILGHRPRWQCGGIVVLAAGLTIASGGGPALVGALAVAFILLAAAWRAVDVRALWLGAAGAVFILALAVQAMLPEAAFVLHVPLIGVMAILAIGGPAGLASRRILVATVVIGGAVFAFLGLLTLEAYHVVGSVAPGLLTLAVLSATLLLLPLIADKALPHIGVAALVAAGLASVLLAATDVFSDRYPKPDDLYHFTDVDAGDSFWATGSPGEVPADVNASQRTLEPFARRSWHIWPTAPASVVRPDATTTIESDAKTLTVSAPAPLAEFVLAVRVSGSSRPLHIDGATVSVVPDQWLLVRYGGARAPRVRITHAPDQKVAVRYLTAALGLPTGSPRQAPPTDWTTLSGSRVAIGTLAAP